MEYEKICYKCDADMSFILYGYPSQALIDIKEEKGWTLGGCTPTDIQFLCKACHSFWSSISGFIASED